MGCTKIQVKGLPRAKEFYVDRLGLPVEEEGPDCNAMVRAGEMRLCIDRETMEEAVRGGGATLFFAVDETTSAARDLKRGGINSDFHKGNSGRYLEAHYPESYKLVFTESLW